MVFFNILPPIHNSKFIVQTRDLKPCRPLDFPSLCHFAGRSIRSPKIYDIDMDTYLQDESVDRMNSLWSIQSIESSCISFGRLIVFINILFLYSNLVNYFYTFIIPLDCRLDSHWHGIFEHRLPSFENISLMVAYLFDGRPIETSLKSFFFSAPG